MTKSTIKVSASIIKEQCLSTLEDIKQDKKQKTIEFWKVWVENHNYRLRPFRYLPFFNVKPLSIEEVLANPEQYLDGLFTLEVFELNSIKNIYRKEQEKLCLQFLNAIDNLPLEVIDISVEDYYSISRGSSEWQD